MRMASAACGVTIVAAGAVWFGSCVSAASDAGSDLAEEAYALINERTSINREGFFVYRDADSALNHGFPSGFFPAVVGAAKIDLDAACVDDPLATNGCSTDPGSLDRDRGTVLRITFDPLARGEFAGVHIEEPEGFGATFGGSGYDLTGATHVLFEARSPTGLTLRFGVDDKTTPFVTLPASSAYSIICIALQQPAVSVCPAGADRKLDLGVAASLSEVHFLFTVVTNDNNAPGGGTILVDNVRYQPVPFSQRTALGLPLSTETFGVLAVDAEQPGRVPIPPDQINRNVSTIYESGLTVLALIARGTAEDLASARLIADAFIYALDNDNSGDPLPVASDGSTGLHSGYMGGDLALFNGQGPGAGQQGEVRLAGFRAALTCVPTKFCLVLDGATGGNNTFALLALLAAYQRFGEEDYLDGARAIAEWIFDRLADPDETGFGGYFLGYPDQGVVPKVLLKGKSIENNADIYVAFAALAAIEKALGNAAEASQWMDRANLAGDFVMEMFDDVDGCFYAGTVPVGTPVVPAVAGIDPTGPRRGNDIINVFKFLDANTFTLLPMAASPRYRNAIDWRRPVRCVLDRFEQTATAGGQTFHGFNLVETPTAGPNGVAWEFTGEAVVTMRFVDHLNQESEFEADADFYLDEIRRAKELAPFTDGLGLVASTLHGGDLLAPYEQCLSTPFQCIPQRVGLAATTWAIFAERNLNPFLLAMTDTDGDKVPDPWDNCTQKTNPDQKDTDADGYGQLCDGDLNNDGMTNTLDLTRYKSTHRKCEGHQDYDESADFNGDSCVNTLDLSIFKRLYRKPPGPSCCGV